MEVTPSSDEEAPSDDATLEEERG
jgi:hypothetical protein